VASPCSDGVAGICREASTESFPVSIIGGGSGSHVAATFRLEASAASDLFR